MQSKLFISFPACIVICMFLSCDNDQKPEIPKPAEVISQATQSVERKCFELLEGPAGDQTITTVWFEITGDSVAGAMNWMPFEKDWAVGTLSGSIKGDIIRCTWQFVQEGLENTTELEFRISEKILYQREQSYDEKTGQAFTRPDAPFKTEYIAVNCDSLTLPELIR